jgi:hypothetical protein
MSMVPFVNIPLLSVEKPTIQPLAYGLHTVNQQKESGKGLQKFR